MSILTITFLIVLHESSGGCKYFVLKIQFIQQLFFNIWIIGKVFLLAVFQANILFIKFPSDKILFFFLLYFIMMIRSRFLFPKGKIFYVH